MAARRPRRSVVVLAGTARDGNRRAIWLAQSLARLGVEAEYIGREEEPERIAAAVLDKRADAVELCFARGAGVVLLRDLLRALTELGRREVSIVVHRFD